LRSFNSFTPLQRAAHDTATGWLVHVSIVTSFPSPDKQVLHHVFKENKTGGTHRFPQTDATCDDPTRLTATPTGLRLPA
jgi:hypothetical protein